jgi:hypothetical protein
MNRCFDNNQGFNSNSRIFNAYYINANNTESAVSEQSKKLAKMQNSKLLKSVLRVAKPVVFSLALVGMVGVAGAIEAGSLDLGVGVAISLALFGIEYLCLRRQRA